jgi:hypothetical protein
MPMYMHVLAFVGRILRLALNHQLMIWLRHKVELELQPISQSYHTFDLYRVVNSSCVIELGNRKLTTPRA